MNPEYKAKWIAALRSGKYEQARSALHQEGKGMCCLGVLCDVVKDEVGGRWQEDSLTEGEIVDFRIAGNLQSNTNYPPVDVYKLVGLDDVRVGRDIPVIVEMATDPCPAQHGLSILNDSGQYTFEQIAAIIEEQL
jgi:hypothetical protein